jgi:hypothetical protein
VPVIILECLFVVLGLVLSVFVAMIRGCFCRGSGERVGEGEPHLLSLSLVFASAHETDSIQNLYRNFTTTTY